MAFLLINLKFLRFQFESIVQWKQGQRWRKLTTLRHEKGLCASIALYLKQLLNGFFEAASLPNRCPFKKVTINAYMYFKKLYFKLF